MKRTVVMSAIAVLVVAVLVAAIVAITRAGDSSSWTAGPNPTDETGPDDLEVFYSQEVDWYDCEDALCADIEVPVDYADPGGETATVHAVYYEATGSGERTMFVNPGGPGGSAVEYASYLTGVLAPEIREAYNIIGVDPRGVGESSPLQCLDDAQFDEFIAGDPDPSGPEQIAESRNMIVQLAEACAANSGALASHVSTAEAARDHDIVRALVGAEEFDWFGASYGTQLGATYADFFPDRVGRMVLDAAVDPSLTETELSYGQAVGFQRALEAWAQDCVDLGCVLGNSVAELLDQVQGVVDRLETDPIPTEDGRLLTKGLAFYGIAVTLYSEQSWPYLTAGLIAATRDDPEVLLSLADFYFSRDSSGEFADNSGQVIYAVNCLDSDEDITLEQMQAELPRFEAASGVFGRALGWGALACSDWPLEANSPQQAVTASGAAPILVLGTTRDPATPYEWSESLAGQLESGVLVSRDGDGHTAYNQGSTCIDDIVNAYFLDGEVPEGGTFCET